MYNKPVSYLHADGFQRKYLKIRYKSFDTFPLADNIVTSSVSELSVYLNNPELLGADLLYTTTFLPFCSPLTFNLRWPLFIYSDTLDWIIF